jgi:hypothetical protein
MTKKTQIVKPKSDPERKIDPNLETRSQKLRAQR